MEMKIGSLFTGIGGLELGVCDTVMSIAPYGNEIEWIAEIDGSALKILEHSTMFCGVPNLGDVTKIDWTTVPDVDCITGEMPCQDFSHLGTRKGLDGEKSSLLYTFIEAVKAKKPEYVLWEDVTGALTKGAYDVFLDALNEADYSTNSVIIPASSLGMPHKRSRLFVFAERTERWATPFNAQLVEVKPDTRLRFLPTPNRSRMDGGKSPGYSERPSFHDLKQWSEDEVRASYGAAIERWEGTLGREAPPLAKPKGTLNVEFVEWMMGFPKGWVTDVDDVSRTAKLVALGNACTPQQASEVFYYGLLQMTRERTSR
nr:MAG TPA: Cytosine specific methyltransferase [Caudoviricetes sp.]